MAGSTKTEFKTSVLQHSSTAPAEENHSHIIAPGLDQFYEFLYNYGLPLILFASLALGSLYMWTMNFNVGK
ncbi:MAG: hypothetical protein EPO39_18375 [Candidatus Manganitrophaceae bacterium]|nr:MAG: hypothetical protein EPO39_18375 [Candidatus Manganitrophaceae bacterium]